MQQLDDIVQGLYLADVSPGHTVPLVGLRVGVVTRCLHHNLVNVQGEPNKKENTNSCQEIR
jgi:hypothetical protein